MFHINENKRDYGKLFVRNNLSLKALKTTQSPRGNFFIATS